MSWAQVCETMVTGVWDNQQPDDLEAGEGVYVTVDEVEQFFVCKIFYLFLQYKPK